MDITSSICSLELLNTKEDDVTSLFTSCFAIINNVEIPKTLINRTDTKFSINNNYSTTELIIACQKLIKAVLFDSLNSSVMISAILPKTLNDEKKNLICKIILEKQSGWSKIYNGSQFGFPKLIDFDWQLHMQTSSNTTATMANPTVRVGMEVEEINDSMTEMTNSRTINFDLTPATLNTMIDGLTKIRDQLSNV